ncbi:hypothetical protein CYMTET_28413 [Cymbomonas tetramitiformis]|uniref:J domain-containing protein n=1 Tax=Cymbomonas tetramitiformis TaxID=36881 RepID=A0AAE0KVY7_9CHLO|nr:hypothetical protein CYMTET_28413 [Cymbomonas tetramitiformis]
MSICAITKANFVVVHFLSQAKARAQLRIITTCGAVRKDAHVYFDYYELLSIEPEASLQDIKEAYRYLQKRCHPDVAGPLGQNMSSLLNEAYSVLRSEDERRRFDVERGLRREEVGFTGESISSWLGAPQESRAVFVDEGSCIGCLKCALAADRTFGIDMETGKARVVAQWGDAETEIKTGFASCPVNCIHWVQKEDLPVLEHVMKQQRMRQGGRSALGPFVAAENFRRRRAERCAEESAEYAAEKRAWEEAAEGIRRHTRRAGADAAARRSSAGEGDAVQLVRYQNNIVPASALRAALTENAAVAQVLPAPCLDDLAAAGGAADLRRMLKGSKAPAGTEGGQVQGRVNGSGGDTWSAELLRQAAERWARGEQAPSRGDDAEYWEPMPILPQEAEPQSEQPRKTPMSTARRATRSMPSSVVSSERFTTLAVLAAITAVWIQLSVGWATAPGTAGLSTVDLSSFASAEEMQLALDAEHRQSEACYQNGGGLCRFMR